jgi:C4-dicarboxylate-specific signal transduction histidine kinase
MAPFARIRQAASWLGLNPNASSDEHAKRLARIQRACSDAVDTIRGSAGGGTLGVRRANLRTIVGQAIRVVQPDIRPATVRLEVRNTIDAPVDVDVVSIVGALVNLLSNAIDAIGELGTLSIATAIGQEGKEAVVRIRNSGSHLTREQVDLFLRPGYTSKSSEGHLGLGLSIAQRAIEMAGGHLSMVPCPEGGVEAIIALPLANNGLRQEETEGVSQ